MHRLWFVATTYETADSRHEVIDQVARDVPHAQPLPALQRELDCTCLLWFDNRAATVRVASDLPASGRAKPWQIVTLAAAHAYGWLLETTRATLGRAKGVSNEGRHYRDVLRELHTVYMAAWRGEEPAKLDLTLCQAISFLTGQQSGAAGLSEDTAHPVDEQLLVDLDRLTAMRAFHIRYLLDQHDDIASVAEELGVPKDDVERVWFDHQQREALTLAVTTAPAGVVIVPRPEQAAPWDLSTLPARHVAS